MTKEELIKNQFPNDEFLQSAVSQIVDKCTADLQSECRTCVYTDSPCVRSDYPSKDGVCSHYKNVFDENVELKQENKVLAQNLEDTEILNKTYEKRFSDLEKENAELKEELKKEGEIISCNTSCYDNRLKLQDQLTKAKEKIHNLLEIIKRPCQFNAPRKIQMVKEAEQFLSEVEK